MDKFTIFFDGSCEPMNPGGTMGFGTLIKRNGVTFHTITNAVAPNPANTNNIAEYRALIQGLQWLIDNGRTENPVEVFGDSNLVIQQMAGNWRAKGGKYYPYFLQAESLRDKFTNISFQWIPREQNAECDALSRAEKATAL